MPPNPFPYFCDFEPELAAKVREGRKKEFRSLRALPRPQELRPAFQNSHEPPRRSSPPAWIGASSPPQNTRTGSICTSVFLAIRQQDIVPLIPDIRFGNLQQARIKAAAFAVDWALADGFRPASDRQSGKTSPLDGGAAPRARLIYATHPNIRANGDQERARTVGVSPGCWSEVSLEADLKTIQFANSGDCGCGRNT